jgi:hypothetical protein
MKIFILTWALNGKLWVPKTNHVLSQKRRKTTLETIRINIKLTVNKTENDHPQEHNFLLTYDDEELSQFLSWFA